MRVRRFAEGENTIRTFDHGLVFVGRSVIQGIRNDDVASDNWYGSDEFGAELSSKAHPRCVSYIVV